MPRHPVQVQLGRLLWAIGSCLAVLSVAYGMNAWLDRQDEALVAWHELAVAESSELKAAYYRSHVLPGGGGVRGSVTDEARFVNDVLVDYEKMVRHATQLRELHSGRDGEPYEGIRRRLDIALRELHRLREPYGDDVLGFAYGLVDARVSMPVVAEQTLRIHAHEARVLGEQLARRSRWFSGAFILAALALGAGLTYLVRHIYASISRILETEREVSRRLAESEAQFVALFSANPVACAIRRMRDHAIVNWNPAFETLTGLSRAELVGRKAGELPLEVQADVRAHAMEKMSRREAIRDIEVRVRRPSGEIRHVLQTVDFITVGGEEYGFATFVDVTERRATEEALRESEKRLRLVIEGSNDGVWDWDIPGDRIFLSARYRAIIGVDSEDAVSGNSGEWYASVLHPEDTARTFEAVRRHLEAREPYDVRIRLRHRDGSYRWVHSRGEASRDAEGRPVRMVGLITDVTERMVAEEALRASETRLNDAQALAKVGNWDLDLRDGALTWSKEIFRIFEIDPEKFGASYEAFLKGIHPEDRDFVNRAYTESVEKRTSYRITHRLLMADGRVKWVEERGQTYYAEDGKPLRSVGTVQDITILHEAELALGRTNAELEVRVAERTVQLSRANVQLARSLDTLRRTQAQLVQSEKMAALGGLVAGVAHEINTPVGIGITAASHIDLTIAKLRERFESGGLTRAELDEFLGDTAEASGMVLSNLQRAAELVKSFKQVAVDQTSGARRQFRLKSYLDEVLTSLGPHLRKTSHEVLVQCPEDIELYGHPGAYSQIVTNLVMNSLVHGFEGRQAGRIEIRAVREGNGLCLTYRDNGRGIAPEHLARIFEPFFTTRRGQGGSGLGMHIVYNLVTQTLGGTIECESTPGEGVRFDIRNIKIEDALSSAVAVQDGEGEEERGV